MIDPLEVSTHSRLKAAGSGGVRHVAGGQVSTHSRLKAAGMASGNSEAWEFVSTHSRLKAAGATAIRHIRNIRFQHTAA